MDLRSNVRSNRSRSKTPLFASSSVEQEIMKGNYQHSITRSTRRTTKINNGHGSQMVDSPSDKYDSNFDNPKPTSLKSSTIVFKTSDYSSEEGEDKVSSTRNVNEYERNRILEDARKLSEDSSGITALGLYRKAKRYWDEYPKTDWTYSPFSKDRVEITPGVVAMPNMSRRHVSSYNKYTQTINSSSLIRPKMLFGHRSETKETIVVIDILKKYAISPLILISAILYFCWRSSSFIIECVHMLTFMLAKHIYRVTCRVMLMDTWLLMRRRPKRKMKLLIALCMVPLILLAGWSTTSSMDDTAILFAFPTFSSESSCLKSMSSDCLQKDIASDRQSDDGKKQFDAQKIAFSLSSDQLEIVAKYVNSNMREQIAHDEIIRELLKTELMKNIIENISENKLSEVREDGDLKEKLQQQQNIIDELTKKLNQLILDLNTYQNQKISNENFISKMQKENVDLISRTLASFLNNPDFLTKQEGLKYWLQSSFIAKNELNMKFANFTDDLKIKFDKLFKSNNDFFMDQITLRLNSELKQKFETINVLQDHQDGEIDLSNQKIKQIVNNILKIYDADKTGLVDYAMEPMGGQVITTRCTESYSGTAVISILGLPLWYPASSPRTVITPGINPGKCWAFQNFPGLLVIKLMARIEIEAFSVEHISKLLVPEGKIDSAPRDFEVFGLRDETDKNGEKLGKYRYDLNGESLQFFKTEKSDLVFEYIELKITSNHGNPNYTCLYRFRVHGKIQTES